MVHALGSLVKKCTPGARKSSRPIWPRWFSSMKVKVLCLDRLSPLQAADLWQWKAGSELSLIKIHP